MACLGVVMRWAVLAAVTLVVTPGLYAQQNPALAGVRMIDLDGRAVRVQAIGLQDRRPGTPVIVFEAGASNSLEVWRGILPQIASMAPVVAYDRAGLGSSEWDDTSPNAAARHRQTQTSVATDWRRPAICAGGLLVGRHARALFRGLLPQ